MGFGDSGASGIYSRNFFGSDQSARIDAAANLVTTATYGQSEKKRREAAERAARHSGGGGIGGVFGSILSPAAKAGATAFLGPIGTAASKALFG